MAISLRGVLSWAKCIEMLDGFVSYNGGPTLKLVMPVLVKSRDLFPQDQMMMGPTLNLKVGKQSNFA